MFETYTWNTDYLYANDNVAMDDFLDNKLPCDYELLMRNGNYCEIQHLHTHDLYSVTISVSDSGYKHKAEFKPLLIN